MQWVKWIGLIALMLFCVDSMTAAYACKPDQNASFQDDFKKPDPTWQVGGNIIYYVEGQLAIKPEPKGANWITPQTFSFKDATYCLDVKSPSDAALPNLDSLVQGGLVFWGIDPGNVYIVAISPVGAYWVYRLTNSSWVTLVSGVKFDKLNAGPSAVNEIKVAALKNVVTVFFNGERATEFRAQAPKDGGRFGPYAGTSNDRGYEWRFLDLGVTE